MCIIGLINNTPKEKAYSCYEGRQRLNRKSRYIKFYLDSDGNINVEYDFPVKSRDECISGMTFEIFICTMHILDDEYEIFIMAFYTDEKLEVRNYNVPDEQLQKLEELCKKLEAYMESESGNVDENNSDDCSVIEGIT